MSFNVHRTLVATQNMNGTVPQSPPSNAPATIFRHNRPSFSASPLRQLNSEARGSFNSDLSRTSLLDGRSLANALKPRSYNKQLRTNSAASSVKSSELMKTPIHKEPDVPPPIPMSSPPRLESPVAKLPEDQPTQTNSREGNLITKGWLLKHEISRSSSSNSTTDNDWRKLWFVLDRLCLRFYRDPTNEAGPPLGVIDLTTCWQIVPIETQRNFGFAIRTERGSEHRLAGLTSAIRQKWVQAIIAALEGGAAKKPTELEQRLEAATQQRPPPPPLTQVKLRRPSSPRGTRPLSVGGAAAPPTSPPPGLQTGLQNDVFAKRRSMFERTSVVGDAPTAVSATSLPTQTRVPPPHVPVEGDQVAGSLLIGKTFKRQPIVAANAVQDSSRLNSHANYNSTKPVPLQSTTVHSIVPTADVKASHYHHLSSATTAPPSHPAAPPSEPIYATAINPASRAAMPLLRQSVVSPLSSANQQPTYQHQLSTATNFSDDVFLSPRQPPPVSHQPRSSVLPPSRHDKTISNPILPRTTSIMARRPHHDPDAADRFDDNDTAILDLLEAEVDSLRSRVHQCTDEVDALQVDNARLRSELSSRAPQQHHPPPPKVDEDVVSRLVRDNERLMADNHALLEERSRLYGETDGLAAENRLLRYDVDRLISMNKEAEQRATLNDQETEQLLDEIKTLRSGLLEKHLSWQTESRAKRDHADSLAARAEQLEAALETERRRGTERETYLRELEAQLETSNIELTTAETQLADAQQQLEALQRDAPTEMGVDVPGRSTPAGGQRPAQSGQPLDRGIIGDFEQRFGLENLSRSDIRQIIDSLAENDLNLRSDVEAYRAECDAARAESDAARADCDQLTDQLELANQRLVASETEGSALRDQLSALQAELDGLRQQQQQRRRRDINDDGLKENSLSPNADASAQVETLVKQLRQAEEDMEKLSREMIEAEKTKEAEIGRLRAEIDAKPITPIVEPIIATSVVAEMQSAPPKVPPRVFPKPSKAVISQFSFEADDEDAKLEEIITLRAKLKVLEASNARLEAEIETAMTASPSTSSPDSPASLRSELRSLKARNATQASEIERQEAAAEVERSRLAELTGEVGKLCDELQQQESELDRQESEIQSLVERLEAAHSENQRLRSALAQQGGDTGTTGADQDDSQQVRLRALETIIDRQEAELASAHAQLAAERDAAPPPPDDSLLSDVQSLQTANDLLEKLQEDNTRLRNERTKSSPHHTTSACQTDDDTPATSPRDDVASPLTSPRDDVMSPRSDLDMTAYVAELKELILDLERQLSDNQAFQSDESRAEIDALRREVDATGRVCELLRAELTTARAASQQGDNGGAVQQGDNGGAQQGDNGGAQQGDTVVVAAAAEELRGGFCGGCEKLRSDLDGARREAALAAEDLARRTAEVSELNAIVASSEQRMEATYADLRAVRDELSISEQTVQRQQCQLDSSVRTLKTQLYLVQASLSTAIESQDQQNSPKMVRFADTATPDDLFTRLADLHQRLKSLDDDVNPLEDHPAMVAQLLRMPDDGHQAILELVALLYDNLERHARQYAALEAAYAALDVASKGGVPRLRLPSQSTISTQADIESSSRPRTASNERAEETIASPVDSPKLLFSDAVTPVDRFLAHLERERNNFTGVFTGEAKRLCTVCWMITERNLCRMLSTTTPDDLQRLAILRDLSSMSREALGDLDEGGLARRCVGVVRDLHDVWSARSSSVLTVTTTSDGLIQLPPSPNAAKSKRPAPRAPDSPAGGGVSRLRESEAARRRLESDVTRLKSDLLRVSMTSSHEGEDGDGARRVLSERISELSQEIDSIKSDYEHELAVQRAAHEREATRLREQLVTGLRGGRATSAMDLREGSGAGTNAKVVALFDDVYAELQAQSDSLLRDEAHATQIALSALRSSHAADIEALHAHYADRLATMVDAESVREMQAQHSEEVARLRSGLVRLSDDYVALDASLRSTEDTPRSPRRRSTGGGVGGGGGGSPAKRDVSPVHRTDSPPKQLLTTPPALTTELQPDPGPKPAASPGKPEPFIGPLVSPPPQRKSMAPQAPIVTPANVDSGVDKKLTPSESPSDHGKNSSNSKLDVTKMFSGGSRKNSVTSLQESRDVNANRVCRSRTSPTESDSGELFITSGPRGSIKQRPLRTPTIDEFVTI